MFFRITSVVLVSLFGVFLFMKNTEKKNTTIGIIQTASHPALDQVRDTFMKEISLRFEGKVDFVVQNAEGSLVQAKTIAETFHAHKRIKAIFAIGTMAAQSIIKIEKEKPVFVSAISDPTLLGVQRTQKNVSGTSDRIPSDQQVALIQKIIPKIKKVSAISNPSEPNSQAAVKELQASFKKKGILFSTFCVFSENEVSQTVMKAARNSEAIIIPLDNLLATAMPIVAKESLIQKCPLFVSDILLVDKGAIAAVGVEYPSLGKETAKIAERILVKKERPSDIGIQDPTLLKTVINTKVQKALGLSFPLDESMTLLEGSHE